MATNSLVCLTALDSQIIGSGAAQIGNRNGHNILDFPSGVISSACFGATLPYQYSHNGLTVYLNYAMASSSGGNVYWGVSFDDYMNNTLDTYSPAPELTVSNPVPSTFGSLSQTSIVFGDGSPISNLNPGDYFLLTVRRIGISGTLDTAYGDAHLVALEIKESS